MTQKIDELLPTDIAGIEAQRKWVREHYTPETESEYETLQGKLDLLDTILVSKWINPDETVKLQCLGIALGDAIVQKLGMKWIAVQDEYGRDPALIFVGTSIIVFPLTMISKRIERGEEVDVFTLFEQVCKQLNEIKQKAD